MAREMVLIKCANDKEVAFYFRDLSAKRGTRTMSECVCLCMYANCNLTLVAIRVIYLLLEGDSRENEWEARTGK